MGAISAHSILTKWILLPLSVFMFLLEPSSQGAPEFCQWDTFKAGCKPDEVAVMRTARYGRMRLGKCVKRDFGYMGCGTDVLTYMDSMCSGKQTCEFTIPDQTMKDMKPCSELESYLEATYTCEKVVTASPELCQSERRLLVTKERGVIASALADNRGLGTARCPWVLQASRGQRLNITLIDFGLATRFTQENGQISSLVCQRYANIKEPHSRSSTLCGGESRTRNIYVSDGNTVEIEIIPAKNSKSSAAFLLKYEVIGCADPKIPKWAKLQRKGNTATVVCDDSGAKWELTCTGNKWNLGTFTNCTAEGDTWNIWHVLSNDWSSPHGILVVSCLGVALGVLIGIVLLVLALLCMRRKRSNPKMEQGCPLAPEAEMGVRHDSMCNNDCSSVPLVTDMRGKEDEYGYRWKARPLVPIPSDMSSSDKTDSSDFPPPPYTDNSTLSRSSGFTTFKAREEHIYESPN